jgi:hypothetical protein
MEIAEAIKKAKEAYQGIFSVSQLEADDREAIARLGITLYINSNKLHDQPAPIKLISEKQLIYLKDLIGKTKTDTHSLLESYRVESFERLSSKQASELIEKLRKKVQGGFALKGGESQ